MMPAARDTADAARRRASRSSRRARPAAARSSRPEPTCPSATGSSCSRQALRRSEPPQLPEVSEPEIVRHYIRLAGATSTSTPASTRSARAR